jgi:hypothetical protein
MISDNVSKGRRDDKKRLVIFHIGFTLVMARLTCLIMHNDICILGNDLIPSEGCLTSRGVAVDHNIKSMVGLRRMMMG